MIYFGRCRLFFLGSGGWLVWDFFFGVPFFFRFCCAQAKILILLLLLGEDSQEEVATSL